MAFFLDEFQHLKIQLDDIKSATDNFNDNNLIGKGGFGNVYKGEISHSKGRSTVAFKRLDSRFGQGNCEFWKEIMMLSCYTHENLVSLLGYCNDGDEKILVYKYAYRGSLDRHLSDPSLTWLQRLKICLGVARGLNYLHDPAGTQQRVLHRDIKSANILLDENWDAKVSDFGLSKISPANQTHTFLVSNVVGTLAYVDPLYLEMGVLTKESDVYSFGVVLFEVLCGRLCFKYRNDEYQSFVRMWKKSYKEKKLDEIISRDLLHQIDVNSLETFSDIAYQCLQKTRDKRPLMTDVVRKLEIALRSQELYEGVESLHEYEAIIMSVIPPLVFRSKAELQALLSKGVIVNGGKTWFWLNKNGEHCEMISSSKFVPGWNHQREFTKNSRFAELNLVAHSGKFKAHIKPQFLSPGITYTINLVFNFSYQITNSNEPKYLGLDYKLEGETECSSAYLAHGREDGWMMVELYQFTSHKTDFDLKIIFDGIHAVYRDYLVVEGIEFRPLERVASEDEKPDMQLVSNSDTDWEMKLPEDYEEIIKWSKNRIKWTTKKKLYLLFCKGFLINNGEEPFIVLIYPNFTITCGGSDIWVKTGSTMARRPINWFFLSNNGKKWLFLPAKALLEERFWSYQSLSNLRFEKVALDCRESYFSIRGEIKFKMLSPRTTYALNLVYKITGDHSNFEKPLEMRYWGFHFDDSAGFNSRYIYLVSPQSPVIRPNVDQSTHNPSQMPKIKGLPRLRNDGWMEVQIWEFETSITVEKFKINFSLRKKSGEQFHGLSVQGIEVKPERLYSL